MSTRYATGWIRCSAPKAELAPECSPSGAMTVTSPCRVMAMARAWRPLESIPSSLVTTMRTVSTVAPHGDGPACTTWTSVEIRHVTPWYGDALHMERPSLSAGAARRTVLVVLSVAVAVAGLLGTAGRSGRPGRRSHPDHAALRGRGRRAGVRRGCRGDRDRLHRRRGGQRHQRRRGPGADRGVRARGRTRVTLDEATLPEEVGRSRRTGRPRSQRPSRRDAPATSSSSSSSARAPPGRAPTTSPCAASSSWGWRASRSASSSPSPPSACR